ncbi:hypothetical protein QFZ23_003454 [Arthrobacter globiformis]|nr:hypothetical protein [Arthrobacter globiformis]
MMDTVTPSTADSRKYALGYAHRCARVFWFWWMGMVFALPGVAQAGALAATGQNPENGLILTCLGLVISGVGWLIAIGPRFTRSSPRPAEDVARAEQYVRIVPGVAIASVVAMFLIVGALMFATPRGTSPAVLPILAFLASFPLPVAAGMLYSRYLHRDRDRLYTAWLARR